MKLAARVEMLERLLTKARADRDDYERRWLAECRAHGETRSKLDSSEARVSELERPSCDPDGPCAYHRSGGPRTIACGADGYSGFNPLAR